MWATSDFVPRSKALAAAHTAGVCSQSTYLWATSDFVPRSEAFGNLQTVGVILSIRLVVGHS